MTLAYEVTGDDPTVVLVHAGIADSRMWDAQWTSFSRSHRVVRYDMRGYGRSPLPPGPYSDGRDLVGILEEVGPAAVVGVSMGGRVALEATVARPELVRALVLVGAAGPDHDWSAEMQAFDAEEEALADRGDAEAYADANIRFWLDAGRPPAAIDPDVRELVRAMILRGFELQTSAGAAEGEGLVPDVGRRLGEVRVPVLVVVGADDVADMHAIADTFERELPNAERATVPGAAHLPPLERPDEFDRVALPFIARTSRAGEAARDLGAGASGSVRELRREPGRDGLGGVPPQPDDLGRDDA